ncbi:MAG: hypothetical protein GQ576_04050 [Methanococcoides sp.]|nr:hypothetical protein [Methanococcoides sp.]
MNTLGKIAVHSCIFLLILPLVAFAEVETAGSIEKLPELTKMEEETGIMVTE